MENLFTFYKKHWFAISVVLILLVSAFFRFYNYTNRYALAGDQARDVIVAREALRSHRMPLIGPFSSAGEFTTGPVWYFWLTASQSIYPNSFITPWIILSLSYVGIVYLMILIGIELKDRSLGIILGLLTAFSAGQIAQSLNVTNPSIVMLFSTLAILFSLKYFKTNRTSFIFLVGIFISLAISAHFQAVYLLPFLFIVLILKRPNLKAILAVLLGLILPTLPYLLFDYQNNYHNLRGIVDYIFYGQYKIYVANRWTTYALNYVPHLWGRLLGKPIEAGYLIIFLLPFAFLYTFINKKITKQIFSIFISTVFVFALLRYYRGEKFDGYFVFLYPFMLILTGWICYQLLKINKHIGIFFTILLLLTGLNSFLSTAPKSENEAYRRAAYIGQIIIKNYPDKKFSIYGYKETSISLSFPVILYLDSQNKIDDNGFKVGMGTPPHIINKDYLLIKDAKVENELWNINSSSSADLLPLGWHSLNPSAIYENTVNWNKDSKESHGLKMLIDLITSKFRK